MYAFVEREPTLSKAGRSIALCAVMALAWLSGCSSEKMGKTQNALGQLYGDYDRGQYAQTLAAAARMARTAQGANQHEAAYLAGLSAYRMQNGTSAERYLRVAKKSPDPAIAGDALALLGLVHNERGRYELASQAFLAAANYLEGEDQAQAYFYAAAAQQKMGHRTAARGTMARAESLTSDPGLRDRITQEKTAAGWTIQTGAFSVESHARREAARLNRRSTGKPWGQARMVPATNGSGHRLLLVQIGRFSSYGRAQMARDRLGLSGARLVPLTNVQ